jgi:hypothetical protein
LNSAFFLQIEPLVLAGMKLPGMALPYFALLSSLQAESFTTNIVGTFAWELGAPAAFSASLLWNSKPLADHF